MQNKFWNSPTSSIKVKICNIQSLDIAFNIAETGADALGFHIKKDSNIKDCILLYQLIISCLRINTNVSCWLLTDIMDSDLLVKIIEETGADTIQFQSQIPIKNFENIFYSLEMSSAKGVKLVKTVSLSEGDFEENISTAVSYSKYSDAILVDSKWERGGTGTSYKYELCNELKKHIHVPIIIAGGLTPENIADVIQLTKPFAVDVQSGVETSFKILSGKVIKIKDLAKCNKFINAVNPTII